MGDIRNFARFKEVLEIKEKYMAFQENKSKE